MAVLRAFGFRPTLLGRLRSGRRPSPLRVDRGDHRRRRRSSSWPGWKERWRASSPASRPAPVIAVPTSVGYGASLEGVTALARHARLVRGRDHRRRHRQRLRCRLRRGEDAPVTRDDEGAMRPTAAGTRGGRRAHRLVPLLLGHRRRHGARQPRRRRRRSFASSSACSTASRSADGRSSSSRCCATASRPPGRSSRCAATASSGRSHT